MPNTRTVQISRRGARDPGGLATALEQAFNPRLDEWYHLGGKGGSSVYRLHQDRSKLSSELIGDLGAELVRLAYREANLAWPLLHEMGDRFTWNTLFRSEETGKNKLLNEKLARMIMSRAHNRDRSASNDPSDYTHYVIHDYPLGPLAAQIRAINQKSRQQRNIVITDVCHTSCPSWESVSDQVPGLDANQKRERISKLKVLDKLVLGRLGADLLFFHTKVWARNFADYVANRFKAGQYKVCTSGDKIWIECREGSSIRTIELIVHAIGVDIDFWTQAASSGVLLEDLYVYMGHNFELPQDKQVLFSYGRLDYTKGVPQRWNAIIQFLLAEPRIEDALFVEVGGPTRGQRGEALPGFQEEWDACVELSQQIELAFPGHLLWIDRLLPQSVIAPLSRHSRVGLFSSNMDGCNLACKEWTVSQSDEDPGVLCLSRTAGAWEELGEIALELNPFDPKQMAHTFRTALTMPLEERRRRNARGKTIIELNPVQRWAEHLRLAAEDKISRMQFATQTA